VSGAFDLAALTEALDRPLQFFDSCESTQTEARKWAADGALPGSLVVANTQTGGRGRQGRLWHSRPGENLQFSLILRPALLPAQAPMLCIAAGVGLARVLDLRIKWPNDLLDGQGRKVVGILAEMEASRGYLEHAILGIGINVNQVDFPPELPNPGSLALLRGPQDRALLLKEVVEAVESECAELSGGPSGTLQRWRARAAHLGQSVRVGEIQGVAIDIREDGALLLRNSEGVHAILAGDVEMLS
jgi:BirA family biotin operon repressor/biotin-[acetyl-CoA-carboxylase] ligase